jgi:succinate-semialdehyde dehydrogenase/glutarate-semialdehyde dehydrogenase
LSSAKQAQGGNGAIGTLSAPESLHREAPAKAALVVASPAPGSGALSRVCPIDLRQLEPVPMATQAEISRAVGRARAASDGWRERSLADRSEPLRRAAKAMLRRRGEILDLVREEMGKLEIEGLFNEALGPLDMLDGWIGVVKRAGGRRRVNLNPLKFAFKSAFVDLLPRGVIGVIAPWNFPVGNLFRSLYPALLTGNGAVLKPSEYTPRSSQWFVDQLAAELPDGLVSVVHGDGEAGAALIDAGIDACVFTGSPRAGRSVRINCAERGIPASIEMGGKDAAIVLADCDLTRTLAGVTHWALSNVGQACGALEIALVESAIADRFVERMASAWRRLRVGGQFADLSPLANRHQFDLVVEHVREAKSLGARVVCGGEPTGEGLFFPPTLLDRCTEEMAVVRDETFGPVLAVVRVESAAEAVRIVNRARYGLGASIWTRDLPRAERLASQIDVGVVDINNHSFTGAVPDLPWSGTRDSGFGVANSDLSLSTFVRPRVVVVDRAQAPEPFWMPFDQDLWEMGNLLADVQIFKIANAWKLPLLWRARLGRIREFFQP